MRPDIEPTAIEGDCAGKTTNDLQALEHSDGRAAADGFVRGRKSRGTSADHNDIIHCGYMRLVECPDDVRLFWIVGCMSARSSLQPKLTRFHRTC